MNMWKVVNSLYDFMIKYYSLDVLLHIVIMLQIKLEPVLENMQHHTQTM